METINEKIRRIRIESKVNQADVARAAGIKQSSYGSIEKGDTKSISIEVGKGIAKALNISFNDLFDIEPPKWGHDNTEKLKAEIEEANKEINRIQETLKDKILLIDFLLKDKEIYKNTVISNIESNYDFRIRELKNELRIAETASEKETLGKLIKQQEDEKQYMFNNFLHIGFFKQEDLDNYYAELRDHYETFGKIQKENYKTGNYSYTFDEKTGELISKEEHLKRKDSDNGL